MDGESDHDPVFSRVNVGRKPDGAPDIRWNVACTCGWTNANGPYGNKQKVVKRLWQSHVDAPAAVVCPSRGKKSFKSRSTAEKELGRAWNTGRRKKLPARAYECVCGYWHMTSKPQRSSER